MKYQIDTLSVCFLDFLASLFYKGQMSLTFHPTFEFREQPRHTIPDFYGGGWIDGSGNGVMGRERQGCYGWGEVEGDGIGLGERYGSCPDDDSPSGFGDCHGFGNGEGSGTGFDNEADDAASIAARLAWMEK